MKVLELFSGVGGMSYSLEAAGIKAEVVAVEINDVANSVYQHNFPHSNLLQKNIVSLSADELSKYAAEVLLMSPPCQPFTRVGLRKDMEDARTDPLKRVLALLPALASLRYILVENVKGFETSEARSQLRTCLEELQFELREFLLSPTQFSVPNMRTRYYLLAKRRPLTFTFADCAIAEKLPDEADELLPSLMSHFASTRTIQDVVETDAVEDNIYQEHLVPEKLLQKRFGVMDIVTGQSIRSCCFTKSYGRYVEGTGSVFCPHDQATVDQVYSTDSSSIDPASVRSLSLRYFTPREVARLMSFPESFQFPPSVTRKQAYQLLGNSINVKVVSLLLSLIFCEPQR